MSRNPSNTLFVEVLSPITLQYSDMSHLPSASTFGYLLYNKVRSIARILSKEHRMRVETYMFRLN